MLKFVVSCEHASRSVPRAWQSLFRGSDNVVESHRGYDVGARELARALAKTLHAPLFEGGVTRLLVDLNRPLHHPHVFSEFTRELDGREKQRLISAFHEPHWTGVSDRIQRSLRRGNTVVHLSIHSFTPYLAGQRRNASVGLLYDPSRPRETALCAAWQGQLAQRIGGSNVRRNYPYRGAASGLTSSLRRRFESRRYLGVEVEINQALVGPRGWLSRLEADLASALHEATRLLRFSRMNTNS